MEVTNAVAIINQGITFFPGWDISAHNYTARHENVIRVEVRYKAKDFSQVNAPDFVVDVENGASAQFLIDAAECDDVITLYRKTLDGLIRVITHEAREAFRVGPAWWGPFNPHMSDGQRNWGDRDGDWAFGLV